MMCLSNRLFYRFSLPLLVAAVCCGVSAARTWTDTSGRSVDADFVRLNGAQVVLKLRSGKLTQVPAATLSPADRDHIRLLLEANGIRVWTDVQGRQIEAQFVRIAEEKVYVRFNGQTTPLPFDVLSVADRRWVRSRAGEKDAAALPPIDADSQLPPPRFWTSTDGNRAEAQFERMLPDGRVMLAAAHGTELVPVDKLSAEDHDFLREQVDVAALAKLIPARPPEPEVEVATATPATPAQPPTVAGDTSASRPAPVVVPPAVRPTPSARPAPAPQQTVSNSHGYSPPAPTRRLVCNKCGKAAPPGAKFGEPCIYCSRSGGNSAYEAGKFAGTIVRYGGIIAFVALIAGYLWRKVSG